MPTIYPSVQKFIDSVATSVKKYAPQYGIKVYSPIIAQAILESGRGTSELATQAQNYFGLKYKEGRCPSAIGDYYKKGSEQLPDGSYVSGTMRWFKFADLDGCVKGYFDFINTSRYANLKGVTDPMTYLNNIKADGYATSINYVNNLYNVIKAYELLKYDVEEKKKTIYRVQVGAYSVKANAEKMQGTLKSYGYNTIIATTEKNGKPLYRVQVGAYSVKANADKLVSTLKTKYNLNAIIIKVEQ